MEACPPLAGGVSQLGRDPSPLPSPPTPIVEANFQSSWEKFTDRTHGINIDKGFFAPGEKPNIDQQLMLIVGEVSEAHEAYRSDAMDDKITTRKGLEVELADAVIRIMNLGRQAGLDIPGAIIEKTAYNATRPYKHGKKF